MRLYVLFCRLVMSFQEFNIFIVSFPKSSLPRTLISQFILLSFTFNHCFRISYCGKHAGGNERFHGHELRIHSYDLIRSLILVKSGFSREQIDETDSVHKLESNGRN